MEDLKNLFETAKTEKTNAEIRRQNKLKELEELKEYFKRYMKEFSNTSTDIKKIHDVEYCLSVTKGIEATNGTISFNEIPVLKDTLTNMINNQIDKYKALYPDNSK